MFYRMFLVKFLGNCETDKILMFLFTEPVVWKEHGYPWALHKKIVNITLIHSLLLWRHVPPKKFPQMVQWRPITSASSGRIDGTSFTEYQATFTEATVQLHDIFDLRFFFIFPTYSPDSHPKFAKKITQHKFLLTS